MHGGGRVGVQDGPRASSTWPAGSAQTRHRSSQGPARRGRRRAARALVGSSAEITEALILAMSVIGPTRLWVNLDCGLKTRGYTG
jgi:Cobalamin-independent synthase, Catalytic domain